MNEQNKLFYGGSVRNGHRWINAKYAADTEGITIQKLNAAIKQAQERLYNNICNDLFSWDNNYKEPTEAEKKSLQRWKLKQKILASWYFIKCRVIGIYNVMLHGECGLCEHDEDY